MNRINFGYTRVVICLLFWVVHNSVYGQGAIHLQRIDQPIILDGVVNEPVWEEIEPFPMTMHVPTFGSAPYHPVKVRVAYDDDYIYLSAVCNTPREELFLTSYRRNHLAPTNDYLGIVLDTFNDNENALVFSVMPTGARLDMAISDDARDNSSINTSWDTFWDAETAILEDGWSVEIRIPFSSLGFQDVDGRVEMGMIAYRWFAVNSSVATFPAIPPSYGFWSFHKPSMAQKIVMEDVYSDRSVYITPYMLGGFDQSFLLNDSETAYERHDEFTGDLGLDVKYGLTNNLTLDVTLNTDFAQVEADDQQVNLSRFPLFFPEKRLFFQERSSIFDFGTMERSGLFDFSTVPINRLFHSRQIGLQEGRPVPLYGGLRLVGRAGGWDIGLLNMQTRRVPEFHDGGGHLPSENVGVLRLRRQLFNPYSYVGVMATSRYDAAGRYNMAYGLDGNFRIAGDNYGSFSLAQTAQSDLDFRFSDIEHSHLQARWEKRSLDGFGYDISLSRSGELYNPETGFNLRSNYTRIGDRIFYGWFPGENSILQQHQFYLNGAVFFRNTDGSVESLELGPSWEAVFNSGNRIILKTFHFAENLEESFSISSGAGIPAGDYHYTRFGASYEVPAGTLRGTVTMNGGTFYDGHSWSFSVHPFWILSRHLQLEGFYSYNRIRFPNRDQKFDGHLTRLKLDAALNREISASAFIQYNSAVDGIFANIRFRYNPREGNNFYIVYDEGMNTNRNREAVVLPRTGSRTILLKYSHTLVY